MHLNLSEEYSGRSGFPISLEQVKRDWSFPIKKRTIFSLVDKRGEKEGQAPKIGNSESSIGEESWRFWCEYHSHWRVGEGNSLLVWLCKSTVWPDSVAGGNPNTASMTQDWFRFSEEKQNENMLRKRQPTQRERPNTTKKTPKVASGAPHSNRNTIQLYCFPELLYCHQAHQNQFLILVVKRNWNHRDSIM